MSSLLVMLLVALAVVSTAASVGPIDESAGAQVAIHVLEKYQPLTTKIIVGTYVVDAVSDFHVIFSFKAFAFNEANAKASNCFSVYDSGRAWRAIPTLAYSPRPDEEPAFCVRRDIVAEDDADSFVVAQFPHENPDNASLVAWSSSSLATLAAEARNRGWTQDPVAPFRVQQLHARQSTPLLTLVTNATVITTDSEAAALAQCPPDPDGLINRKLEGDSYYKGLPGKTFKMLCVSYVQRSIHRVDPKERFFSDTRFVVKSIWRLLICPFVSDAVQDVSIDDDAIFLAKDQDELLLCYTRKGLFDEDDENKPIADASPLVKRVTITDLEDGFEKRLQVEYHGKDAWALPRAFIGATAINQF